MATPDETPLVRIARFVQVPVIRAGPAIHSRTRSGGSVSDGGVVGALSASFAARFANFFCSRRSALARCFSCLFSSFWRF